MQQLSFCGNSQPCIFQILNKLNMKESTTHTHTSFWKYRQIIKHILEFPNDLSVVTINILRSELESSSYVIYASLSGSFCWLLLLTFIRKLIKLVTFEACIHLVHFYWCTKYLCSCICTTSVKCLNVIKETIIFKALIGLYNKHFQVQLIKWNYIWHFSQFLKKFQFQRFG